MGCFSLDGRRIAAWRMGFGRYSTVGASWQSCKIGDRRSGGVAAISAALDLAFRNSLNRYPLHKNLLLLNSAVDPVISSVVSQKATPPFPQDKAHISAFYSTYQRCSYTSDTVIVQHRLPRGDPSLLLLAQAVVAPCFPGGRVGCEAGGKLALVPAATLPLGGRCSSLAAGGLGRLRRGCRTRKLRECGRRRENPALSTTCEGGEARGVSGEGEWCDEAL